MTKRKRLPLRWARKLLQKQGGRCAVPGCGIILVLGPQGQHTNFIDEHIQPLSRGGKNTLRNRELRCIPCGAAKTFHPRGPHTSIAGDNFEAKKTTRLRSKARSRPLSRAPFPGSRASPWKRLVTGRYIKRCA